MILRFADNVREAEELRGMGATVFVAWHVKGLEQEMERRDNGKML